MKLFPKREEGQGLVEYALLLVLVAIVVIAVLLLLGPQINNIFNQIIVALGGQPAGSNYAYTFQKFRVDGHNNLGACDVSLDDLKVKVTENGSPVSNASVTVTVSLQAGGSKNYSGTTNAGGEVSWSGGAVGTDPNPCGGRTARAVVGSVQATDGY